MVAPVVRFRGDTRSGVSWYHPLSRDASAAVTEFGEYLCPIVVGDQKKRSLPLIS